MESDKTKIRLPGRSAPVSYHRLDNDEALRGFAGHFCQTAVRQCEPDRRVSHGNLSIGKRSLS